MKSRTGFSLSAFEFCVRSEEIKRRQAEACPTEELKRNVFVGYFGTGLIVFRHT